MGTNFNSNHKITDIKISGNKYTIAPFHGTEAEWNSNLNYIPSQGEIIIYDIDNNNTKERIKIGDGVTPVVMLPFISEDKSQVQIITWEDDD